MRHDSSFKILSDLNRAHLRAEECRKAGKIVLTTGIWDLLHEGHVTYLENASQLGAFLFVGVDSNALIRSGISAKDSKRPILDECVRLRVVAGLTCVDYAFLFDDRMELVRRIMPDIIVVSTTSKGDPDYKRFDAFRESGIEIKPIASMSSVHTSGIIADIVARYA